MPEKHAKKSRRSGPADLRRQAERRLPAGDAASAEGLPESDTRALVHKLEMRQIELEMQNEELRRARRPPR